MTRKEIRNQRTLVSAFFFTSLVGFCLFFVTVGTYL